MKQTAIHKKHCNYGSYTTDKMFFFKSKKKKKLVKNNWGPSLIQYCIFWYHLFQYPAEGALDHMEMTKLVWECDYLLPNHCSDSAQEIVSKVGQP